MDKKDLQIVELLGKNCRLQYSTIADSLSLSKDTIRNRIEALEKSNVLTHYNTLLDLRPLGMMKFHLLIKFREDFMPDEMLINKLKKIASISFMNSFIGKYDLHIIIDTKTIYEYEKLKSEIFDLLGDEIQDYTIMNYVYSVKFSNSVPATNLNTKFDRKLDSSFSSILPNSLEAPKEFRVGVIDKLDSKLLEKLGENPRATLVELSESLKVNRETIKNRITALIKKGIILGFGANANFDSFGYNAHFMLIKTAKNDFQDSSLKEIPNVFYSAVTQGEYNLIIYLLAKTPSELRESINEIKKKITNILEMEILIFDKIYIFNQLPKGIF